MKTKLSIQKSFLMYEKSFWTGKLKNFAFA